MREKNGPEKLRIRTLFTLFFFIEKKIKEWYVDKEETIWQEKLWLLEKKIATNLFGLTDGSHLDNTVD